MNLPFIIFNLSISLFKPPICECKIFSLQEEVLTTTTILTGKVIAVSENYIDVPSKQMGFPLSTDVTIRVETILKGEKSKVIVVRAPFDEAACGFHFQRNKKYLLFASTYEGTLSTNSCTRTQLLDGAENQIKAIRELLR
jgi:hypothetical protein